MEEKSFLDTVVFESAEPGAKLIRFLIGDRFHSSIDKVLTGKDSPVGYAQGIISECLTLKVIKEGMSPELFHRNTPGWIKQLYVYDEVTAAGLVLRLGTLFPDTASSRFREMFLHGQLYLLNLTDKKYPLSIAGGLSSFGQIAARLMTYDPGRFRRPEGVFLSNMIKPISYIQHPNWFLRLRAWQSLYDYPELMKAFRQLLFLSVASFWFCDTRLEKGHGITRDDLTTYMYDLTRLLSYKTTTTQEVVSFARRLRYDFSEIVPNIAYDTLLVSPFDLVNMFFKECNENPQLFFERLHKRYQEQTV